MLVFLALNFSLLVKRIMLPRDLIAYFLTFCKVFWFHLIPLSGLTFPSFAVGMVSTQLLGTELIVKNQNSYHT